MKHTLYSKGKTRENAYFHEKDAELIERLRRGFELEAERQRLGEAIGVADQSILRNLQDLGYTRDTIMLLPLVPLVQVAWVDGELASRESERIRELVHIRGLGEGTPAFDLLESWLRRRPSDEFFLKTLCVIRNLLSALHEDELQTIKQDLISCCTYIARGSGAILGLGNEIGSAEQQLLAEIANALELENREAARAIVRQL